MSNQSYSIAYVHGISRVHAFPKYHEQNYEVLYITKRTGFLGLFGPKVTTRCISGGWCSDEMPVEVWLDRKPNRYIEDDQIYMEPHADICYVDGKATTQYFKTVEELNSFMEDLKSKGVHVIL